MNRHTRPLFAAAILATVAACATADNPQRLGGVNISGSVVFLDGNLSKAGDNGASSHQVPTNETRATVPVNTGASGLPNTGAEIVRELVNKPRIDAEKTSPEAK